MLSSRNYLSESADEKPCLVQTGRGFSVKYKGIFLYSKYDPKKSILRTVQSAHILPGTLVLAVSPCLGYGLEELAEKLPENAAIFVIERDKELLRLSREHCGEFKYAAEKKCFFFPPDELTSLPAVLNGRRSDFRGKFRRVMRIDFSAGTQLNASFYTLFYNAMQESIAQFWKNRLTLIKFGRRYSRNFFRNICAMKNAGRIENLFRTVTKPVLVCGAGESMEAILSEDDDFLRRFYIIAADASLCAFRAKKKHVDAVVCEESQTAIAKAFIGCRQYAENAFISLSSCPETAVTAGKKAFYYTTLFDDRHFIAELAADDVLPAAVPPVGSVGLTAVYLALKLRADETVPVCFTGLDFSFAFGKTHAAGTFADIQNRSETNRLSGARLYASSFSEGTTSFIDIAGKKAVTTVALSGYASLMNKFFQNEKNLFDCRKSGITIALPSADIHEIACKTDKTERKTREPIEKKSDESERRRIFFENEIAALSELQNILSHGQNEQTDVRNAQIKKLLEQREYLFLHFPDGISSSLDVRFLKRVRAETDAFLKLFNQLRYL